MRKLAYMVLGAVFFAGCANWSLPVTLGEKATNFGYVPLDPIPVLSSAASCDAGQEFESLPTAFPDNTVRIAYKTVKLDGSVSFGPIATTQQGESYQIVIDFITADVRNFSVFVKPYKSLNGAPFEEADSFDVELLREREDARISYLVGTKEEAAAEVENCRAAAATTEDKNECAVETPLVNIPIYLGVGLRITADLVGIKGGTQLNGLTAISAATENGYVSGSMVVQTLGINGKSITAAMPIQSDLNQTTIQNAIVAIGSIKALMYEPGTNLQARIVGFHDPIGGGQPFANALVSKLASAPPVWSPRCVPVTAQSAAS